MKPFSTYQEQIGKLKTRGLIIHNDIETERILERENYYNIINGYKCIFLARGTNGEILTPETFKKYTSFEEIHSLFTFDRDLRNLLMKYILMFENSIKTKLSYRFSEKYSEAHAYLQLNNFSKAELNRTLKLLAIFTNVIKNKSQDKYSNSIKHYLNKYEHVPLWVLVNDLTLGNISNFYQSLDDSLKDTIARDFSIHFKREYNSKFQIPVPTIVDVLKISNLVRNICAHEERLYNFILENPTKVKHNSQLLSIPKSQLQGDIFTLFALLKLVLPKKDHKALQNSLRLLFDKYENKFRIVPFKEIMLTMGFETNWETFF